ncbi:3-oxoacyl-reductase, partial [Caulochytrium protostelioides]
SIVHVGSVLGRRGRAGQAVYSASKAGLEGLTRGLAAEYGPRGIRTNLVAPGWIATAMTDAYPADTVAEIRARIPLGRLGSPDEVADAVMFLVTNRYMNGATLTLDGGLASSL